MGLIALLCPDCGSVLPDSAELRVRACSECGASWSDFAGAALRRASRSKVDARRSATERPGSILTWMPVWEVALRASEMPGAGASLPEEIFVPAVGISRLPLLLRFARNLNRAPREELQRSGEPDRPVSVEVGPEDAFAMAETIALRLRDGWPSDAELDSLVFPFGGARLLDWPIEVASGEIVELVTGISAPRALLAGLTLVDQRSEVLSSKPSQPHV